MMQARPLREHLKVLPPSYKVVRWPRLLLTAAYDKILLGVKFLNAAAAGYSTLYV